MKKKKVLPLLGILLAGGLVFGAANLVDAAPVSAATVSTDWQAIGSGVSASNITNGVSFAGLSGYGNRIAKKEKVKLDGLKFTVKIDGYVDNGQDCRGWYIHNGSNCYDFFSETTAMVFSYWTNCATQLRCVLNTNHDHAGTSYCMKDPNGTVTGWSAADNAIIQNFASTYSTTIEFKEYNSDYYKLTVYGNQIWGSVNYNAVSGYSIFTYLKKTSIPMDASGNTYLAFYGLALGGATSDYIDVTNISNAYEDEVNTFAQKLLTDTSVVCDAGDVTKAKMQDTWDALSTEYSSLSSQAKALFVAAKADQAGSVLEQAVARYERIVSLHGMDNFAGRTIAEARNTTIALTNETATLIAIITCATLLSTIAIVAISRKKKQVR